MDNVMESHGLDLMADKDKDRFQVSITLSEKAYEEFQAVAEWKKIPMATLLRQILEREHESPAFANLHKRTKQDG